MIDLEEHSDNSSVTDEKTSELEWIPQDQATNRQITLDQRLCPNMLFIVNF